MGGSLPSKVRGAIPWGLLGMLVLVGSIERTLIRENLALSNPLGDCWNQTARRLKRAARGCDVLCFGDSMVKYGLIPGVVRGRSGRSAFNLAVVGGSAPSSEILLRRALDAGARPSTIFVDFDRTLLQTGPDSRTVTLPWADLVDLREAAGFCRAARNPDLFAWIALARLVPSIKNRHEVRAYVLARLRGEKAGQEATALQLRRNWTRNRGALVNAKHAFEDFPASAAAVRRRGTWRPHPANVRSVHRFLELAAQGRGRGGHTTTVVWLLPPVSPGTQRIWESWGDEELFERFARSMLARHPNLVVLDGRHAGYEATVFHDAVHLDRDGAIALSGTVADLLRRGVLDPTASTRWITLPAFQRPAGASPFPLEDLAQSGAAVLQALDAKGKVRR